LLERVTEVSVIVALFIGGLKLRLPLRDPAWYAAYRLAGPLMLLSIAGVALVADLLFPLSAAACLLFGAVLAPTDPVLASSVAVNDSRDRDRLRYGLSGEAGLNDGMAFPFVVFALTWLVERHVGSWVVSWALERVLWGVPAALGLGHVMGHAVGRMAIWLRARDPQSNAPNDLLILALICLSYVLAEQLGAWGFLAVFAAGVGLRHAEVRVVRSNPHPDHVPADDSDAGPASHPPAEYLVSATMAPEVLNEPAVAAGVLVAESLSFGETLERLIEFVLVLCVGVALVSHWEPRALVLGAALLFVIRPLGAALILIGTPTSPAQRWLMGWFGVRGVGSLYYLSYALTRGLDGEAARIAVATTLWVIAASIVLHGMSAAPLITRYQRAL
jgi:sodium/hydrogen antiporter